MPSIRSLALAGLLVLLAAAAHAQATRVHQTGTSTRGHATLWMNPGVVGDAGGALNGKVKALGIIPNNTTPQPPFCVNDTFISNPGGYHQLCATAADAFGDGGQLAYNAIGPAPNDPLTMQSANKLIMTSGDQQIVLQNLPQTVSGDVPVCINQVTGQLFQASATDQVFILTDDTGSNMLTDDAGANFLTATIPAGKCVLQ